MPMREVRAARAQMHPAGPVMIAVANAVARIHRHHFWTPRARQSWAMMDNRALRPGRIATAVAHVQPADARTIRHKILFRVKSQQRQARNARVLAGAAMAPIQIKFRVSQARIAAVARAVKAADKIQVNVVTAPQVSRV